MAAIVKQDVLDFATELSVVKDPAWAVILAYVMTLGGEGFCETEDGPTLRFARILLAAHFGTISKRGKSGAAGPVTSEAAGAVRRSYGLVALAQSAAGLGTTVYGAQFTQLVSMSCSHGPVLI
jgi:hypothetical protein